MLTVIVIILVITTQMCCMLCNNVCTLLNLQIQKLVNVLKNIMCSVLLLVLYSLGELKI